MLGALAGSAHVSLSVNTAQFRRDWAAADAEFGRRTGSIQRQAQRTGLGIQRAFRLGAGLLGVAGGLYLAQRALRAVWQEMQDGARVNAQTNAVLASTGGLAGVTAKQVEELAGALQRLSGVDDEVIQHGANVLLTFRNVRNEVGAGNDIFNQAVEALLDMGFALRSVGSGGESLSSLQSEAIRLGKALNDPIQGITALRRVGVTFTRDQQKMIERLVESGRVLEAQRLILAELRVEFGGSARAVGEEFPAALERLRNTAASAAAVYLEALVPALEDGAEWLQRQIDAFADNEQAQEEFRATVTDVAETVTDLVGTADAVAEAFGGWANVLEVIVALKIANLLLLMAVRMKILTGETWKAAFAFTALGAAANIPAFPRWGRGLPLPGPGGLGRLAVPAIGLSGAAVAVAAGGAVVLATTPGSTRRDRDATSRYPYLWRLVVRRQKGQKLSPVEQAILNMLDRRRAFSEQDPRVLRNAETAARGIAEHAAGSLADAHDRAPQPGRSGKPPAARVPKTELSIATQQALAEADRTASDVDDLKALQRAERELERMLKQSELTKQERLDVTQDLARIEGAIRSIEESRARDAETARDKAKREAEERKKAAEEERQNAHEQRAFELERAIARAEETAGVEDDLKRLHALRGHHRRWRDQQKRGTDDWRQAQADLDSVNDRIASVRQGERARREQVKRWRLERRVRLAEETEGIEDDLEAYRALRAHLLAVRREQKRYSDEWMASQDEIDDTNRRIREARKSTTTDQSENSKRLADELQNVLAEFAPNFFPADGGDFLPGAIVSRAGRARDRFGRGGLTIVQEFPTAPTDYHKEGRSALAMARAVFDG